MRQNVLNRLPDPIDNAQFSVSGQRITEQRVRVRDAITSNSRVRLQCNAFTIKNVGTNPATVDGELTINSGDTFSLHTDNPFVILNYDFVIRFSGGGTNRIEIVELLTIDPILAHYTEKLKTRNNG